MLVLKGKGMESIVLDGEWLEKLRGPESVMRVPAAQYRDMDVQEVTRKTKLFGGEKEQRLEIVVNVGTFMSLSVAAADRELVERLRAELEAAARA